MVTFNTITSINTGLNERDSGDDAKEHIFVVRRFGDIDVASSVEIVFTAGETDADDFVGGVLPSNEVLEFAAGVEEIPFTVFIAPDDDFEDDESFTFQLQNATNSQIAPTFDTVDGIILNDDTEPVPSLSISAIDAVKSEGDTGSTTFSFTVTRTGQDLSGESTVKVILNPSQTDGADFVGGLVDEQTVTFAADQTSKIVEFQIQGDTTAEGDESFRVDLEDPTNATIESGAETATGTILDDDTMVVSTPPTISLTPATATTVEGDSGTTNATFVINRTGDLTGTSSVDVTFAAGETDASDFVGGLPGTQAVNFAAGETEKTVTVAIAGDGDFEADETFTLTLANVSGATLSATANTSDRTIANDDEEPVPPVVKIEAVNADRDEGDSGTQTFSFSVSRSGDLSATSSVDVGFAAGDTDAADFGGALPGAQTVNFAAGQATASVSFSVSGDETFEGDEAFSVSLSNAVDATIDTANDTANGAIRNDDVDPADDDVDPTDDDVDPTDDDVDPTDDFVGPTDGDDVLTGTGSADDINSLAGDDTVSGLGGADTLNGAGGADSLVGGGGADSLLGGNGADTIKAGGGKDTLKGGGGADSLSGAGGADDLNGAGGRDELDGGGGNDIVNGGGGKDTVLGGGGADSLAGNAGQDELTGGAGGDRFIFNAVGDSGAGNLRDVITDFGNGLDKIDVSGIDAATGGGYDGDQAFAFIGASAFSGTAGELRFGQSGDDVIVSGDTNGDGRANFSVLVEDTDALQAGDFIL